MTRTEIDETVRRFLVENLEVDDYKIARDARMKEDIDIDSLDIADIIVFVEEKFGFVMTAEQTKRLVTLNDFCSFIEKNTAI